MSTTSPRPWRTLLLALAATPLFATGCTVHYGGQTLPNPHYMDDDVQYFAPGPEFILSNEAAALEAAHAEQALRQGP